jgi:hypothetical protein
MSILKPREPKQAAIDQDETTGDFDAYWNEQAYLEIERSSLALIKLIERLVRAGHTPDQIKRRVLQTAPQRWPQAVQVEQAARWVARGQGG